MSLLKFSPANAKLKRMVGLDWSAKWLDGKRKVFSLDLLSGHNCPYAKDCLSKAVVGEDGKRHIEDGPHTDFRCFSASQEVLFPNVYKQREYNANLIKDNLKSVGKLILASLPKKAGIVRLHVGGDFRTQDHFDGLLDAAEQRPDVLFYAYTKSLPFWVKRLERVGKLPNVVLTASRGGFKDSLIDKHNLRSVIVLDSVAEAEKLGLPVDHDDSHAACPDTRNESFALLIHGTQKAGSKRGKAVRELNGVGSYGR